MTALNIHSLAKNYCTGIFSRQNKVSLKIKDLILQNGIYGIIGKNGSGKSTMAKSLSEIIISKKKIDTQKKFLYLNNTKDIYNPNLSIHDNLKILFTTEELAQIKKKFNSDFNFKNFIFNIIEYGSEYYNFIFDEDFANSFLNTTKFEKLLKKKQKNNIFFIISHNIDIIKRICKYSLIIRKGNIDFFGETKIAISYYYEDKYFKIKKNSNIFLISNVTSFKDHKTNKLTVVLKDHNIKNKNIIIIELSSNNLVLFSKKFIFKTKLTFTVNRKILEYGRYELKFILLNNNVVTNTISTHNKNISFYNKKITNNKNGIFFGLIHQV